MNKEKYLRDILIIRSPFLCRLAIQLKVNRLKVSNVVEHDKYWIADINQGIIKWNPISWLIALPMQLAYSLYVGGIAEAKRMHFFKEVHHSPVMIEKEVTE